MNADRTSHAVEAQTESRGDTRINDQVLTADLVFPVEGDPIPNGSVWIADGKIRAVGAAPTVDALLPAGITLHRRSFAGCALIPGFVNPHAHLELSSMRGRIPRPAEHNEDFTDWIKHVLAIRETWGPAEFDESGRYGARLLLEAGTTTIGDVTASGTTLQPLIDSRMRAIVFQEVLGFGPERESRAIRICEEWMAKAPAALAESEGRVTLALSPHAPHSTSPNLYRFCAGLASKTGTLLSTHISETREEIELIRSGSGPFRRLLAFRGLPVDDWATPGVTPVQYLSDLGILNQPGLAIHVNYVSPGDAEILAKSQFTPVYCPQSHQFLGHVNHPAFQFIQHGLKLALGTDSLASNDSLEMLDELRLLCSLFHGISPTQALEIATIQGAMAMKWSDQIGSLTPGKFADIAVIALNPSSPDPPSGAEAPSDPAAAILSPGAHVIATMVEGEWLFDRQP